MHSDAFPPQTGANTAEIPDSTSPADVPPRTIPAPPGMVSGPPDPPISIEKITFRKRCLIGGLGALMPILLNLVVVDLKVVFNEADTPGVLTYCVRTLALFALGAITAWLYDEEHNTRKLFQLGIAGPALLAAIINGVNVDTNKGLPSSGEDTKDKTSIHLFVTPAYAQESQDSTHSFTQLRPLTTWEKVLRGLIGRDERGPWFVALRESYENFDEARRRATQLQESTDFSVKVYELRKTYLIVLGDWLEQDDARKLHAQADAQGLAVRLMVYSEGPAGVLPQ